jgi:hypothetical protein
MYQVYDIVSISNYNPKMFEFMDVLFNALKDLGFTFNIIPGIFVKYKNWICYVRRKTLVKDPELYILVKLFDGENVEEIVARKDEIIPIFTDVQIVHFFHEMARMIKEEGHEAEFILKSQINTTENRIKSSYSLKFILDGKEIFDITEENLYLLLLEFIFIAKEMTERADKKMKSYM